MLLNISEEAQNKTPLQSALRVRTGTCGYGTPENALPGASCKGLLCQQKPCTSCFSPETQRTTQDIFKPGCPQQQQDRGSNTANGSWRVGQSVVFNTQRQRKSRMKWQHRKLESTTGRPGSKPTSRRRQTDALPLFLRRKSPSPSSAEQSLLRDQIVRGSVLNSSQRLLEAPR